MTYEYGGLLGFGQTGERQARVRESTGFNSCQVLFRKFDSHPYPPALGQTYTGQTALVIISNQSSNQIAIISLFEGIEGAKNQNDNVKVKNFPPNTHFS